MNDRELLEAAARAAGIGGGWDWPRGAKAPTYWRDADGRAWQPLNDDGDALRLAVKLDIRFWPTGCNGKPTAATPFTAWTDETEGDPYAATRRAIVRAAAALSPTTQPQEQQQ